MTILDKMSVVKRLRELNQPAFMNKLQLSLKV
jgi:hypothetical protein